MKLKFEKTEHLKKYRSTNGIRFEHNETKDIDDDIASVLLQDFPDNFSLMLKNPVHYQTANFTPAEPDDEYVEANITAQIKPKCSWCGATPAKRKEFKDDDEIYFACKTHSKKRKPPEHNSE